MVTFLVRALKSIDSSLDLAKDACGLLVVLFRLEENCSWTTKKFYKEGGLSFLLKLFSHPSDEVASKAAIAAKYFVAAGSEGMKDAVVNNHLLSGLLPRITFRSRRDRSEACEIIAKLVRGSRARVQAIGDKGFLQPLVDCFELDLMHREGKMSCAAAAIRAVVRYGTADHVNRIVVGGSCLSLKWALDNHEGSLCKCAVTIIRGVTSHQNADHINRLVAIGVTPLLFKAILFRDAETVKDALQAIQDTAYVRASNNVPIAVNDNQHYSLVKLIHSRDDSIVSLALSALKTINRCVRFRLCTTQDVQRLTHLLGSRIETIKNGAVWCLGHFDVSGTPGHAELVTRVVSQNLPLLEPSSNGTVYWAVHTFDSILRRGSVRVERLVQEHREPRISSFAKGILKRTLSAIKFSQNAPPNAQT